MLNLRYKHMRVYCKLLDHVAIGWLTQAGWEQIESLDLRRNFHVGAEAAAHVTEAKWPLLKDLNILSPRCQFCI